MSTVDRSRSRSGRRLALVGLAGLSALAAACGSSGNASSGGGNAGGSSPSTLSTPPTTGGAGSTTAPRAPSTTGPASATLRAALDEAYETETETLATYKNVIAALGPVGPFANVAQAEQAHVVAVRTLFSHYALSLPSAENGESSPSTRTAACGLGVTMEKKVVSMYGELIPKVSAYPDVAQVFKNLESASRESHLPAFEHCA